MKPRLTTAAVLGLLITVATAPAQQFFSENFNYGVLNPNLTTTADYGSTITVTTNADGNGVLNISQTKSGALAAAVTTSFNAVGDFTAVVKLRPGQYGPNLPSGLKMVTAQGEASVYLNNGGYYDGLHSDIWFPSFTNSVGITHNNNGCCFDTLQIRRVGSALFFEWGGPEFACCRVQAATNAAFAAPARIQLFVKLPTDIYNTYVTLFDDLVITADQFNPTPTPTLTTLIAPVAFQISWPSQTNRHYQVWSATNLAPNVWSPLGSPLNGTGFWMSVTDWVSGPRRFYQAVEAP